MTNFNDFKRINKIFLIITLSLVIITISILLTTPSSKGYEISIYDNIPLYFWILIIISFISSELFIFFNRKSIWIYGLIIIFFINAIILFMPFIRGYATYGSGDVLTHIGITKDIISTGVIPSYNFYPVDHIIAMQFSALTSIQVEKSVSFISAFFSYLYIIFIFLFSRFIFRKTEYVAITMMFASIPIFPYANLLFAPNLQAFFVLPILLFVYCKNKFSVNQIKWLILLFILLLLIVFFHPMSTYFFILVIFLLEVSIWIYKKIKKLKNDNKIKNRNTSRIFLFITLIFSTWYLSFNTIIKGVRRTIEFFKGQGGSTPIEGKLDIISNFEISLFDLLIYFLTNYITLIILGSISLFFSIFMTISYFKKSPIFKITWYDIYFGLGFFLFSMLYIGYYFVVFIGRPSKYLLFFLLIYSSLAFSFVLSHNRKYNFSISDLKNKKNKYIVNLFLFFVIFLLIISSIFTIYFSPIIKRSNQGVSNGEIIGAKFFFNYRNESLKSKELGISQLRFHDFIYGKNEEFYIKCYGTSFAPKDHFGYNYSSNYGNLYEKKFYLIIGGSGKNFYPSTYPQYKQYWRFKPKDFFLLNNDKTVINIYMNNDIDVYQIH